MESRMKEHSPSVWLTEVTEATGGPTVPRGESPRIHCPLNSDGF